MKRTLLLIVSCGLLCGCAHLKDVGEWVKWWETKPDIVVPDPKPKPDEPVWEDDVDLSKLAGIHGWDTRGWKITSDLHATWTGSKLILKWNSTQWKTINANVGSVWCAFQMVEGGPWSKAWRYDQIRHGQGSRDYPRKPPHPKEGHGDYMTVPAGAHRAMVWISTMARKAGERNGEERTKAAIIHGW